MLTKSSTRTHIQTKIWFVSLTRKPTIRNHHRKSASKMHQKTLENSLVLTKSSTHQIGIFPANWVIICYRYHLLREPGNSIDLWLLPLPKTNIPLMEEVQRLLVGWGEGSWNPIIYRGKQHHPRWLLGIWTINSSHLKNGWLEYN